MNKLRSLLATTVFLASFASITLAYPTLNGPTGGLEAPTAAVQSLGEFDAALDWSNTDPDDALAARALFGLLPGLEVGAKVSRTGDNNNWGVNAKYALPLPLLMADWAAGAQYQHDGDLIQLYLVTTRAIVPFVHASLGAMYTDTDIPVALGFSATKGMTAPQSDSDIQGFLNVEAALFDIVSVGGEYFFGGDADDYANLYGRFAFNERLGAQIGMRDIGADKNDEALTHGLRLKY